MTTLTERREEFLHDLQSAIDDAEGELKPLSDRVNEIAVPLQSAATKVGKSWSHSNVGPHASMYFRNMEEPPAGFQWDAEWGFLHRQPGWVSKTEEEIVALVEAIADCKVSDLEDLGNELRKAEADHHHNIAVVLESIPVELLGESDALTARRQEFLDLKRPPSPSRIAQGMLPANYVSRDAVSVGQGAWVAPHQGVQAKALAAGQHAEWAESMIKLARRIQAAARAVAAPTGTPRTEPAPSQPAPSQPAPSQPAPSQPAPSQPTPSQPAPSQPTPSQPAAVQPQVPIVQPVPVTRPSDVRIPAIALAIVLATIGGVAMWLSAVVATYRDAASGLDELAWRCAAAAVGGVGIFSFVMLVVIVIHGAFRADPSYLRTAWEKGWKPASAGAALTILAFLFGLA